MEVVDMEQEQTQISRNEIVIETAGLEQRFGDVVAVKDFSVSIYRGEMFGLVGPDSAGKSTTIRLLCGILKPTGGSGKILGYDLFRESQKIKSQIGYLSQDFTLYGDLSVDENIEFFAYLHGVKDYRERREHLLAFTRLTQFRKRLAQDLSGGMKKKLALACALIHTPKIMFLDEPSTGVDPVSRWEFWNILGDVLLQGVTIVMTTPYLDEAERCDRICLMHKGEIVKTGKPQDVISSMNGEVYDIDCPNPVLAYQILRVNYSPLRFLLYGDRLRFWTNSIDEIERIVRTLEENGISHVKIERGEPTLEDAFVSMTGEEVFAGGLDSSLPEKNKRTDDKTSSHPGIKMVSKKFKN
ncbi:MAG: ABC transporter ATP-binding protein [Verrucomicrobiae bacterium]|nr:ABC transporter ATP-binding protein [Verrucomicrobiae bacterium]